ncbi:repeat protein [Moumouvirus goulette]|uniref:Repeat protein n=1 Tax=Moumouvirus goulette TaxID=1247379 RepID=M1PNS1_9VIRU|nr:repeat protein [Moumouvirus goulette]AGF85676.1 repeat protein [Moumouvirus goulette]
MNYFRISTTKTDCCKDSKLLLKINKAHCDCGEINIFKQKDFYYQLQNGIYLQQIKFKFSKIELSKWYDLSNAETFKHIETLGLKPKNNLKKILEWAIENNFIDIVNYCVTNGIDINGYNGLAIKLASQLGKLEIVKLLIEKGATINIVNDPAVYAAVYNHIEVLNYLVKYGGNVSAMNNCAIIKSSEYGYFEIVKILLKHGADVQARNNEPLIRACSNGHLNVVKYLLKYGADIKTDNYDAINRAIIYGHLPIIKYVLDINNDIYVLLYSIKYSIISNELEILKYLIIRYREHSALIKDILICTSIYGSIKTIKCILENANIPKNIIKLAIYNAHTYNNNNVYEYLVVKELLNN